MSRSLFVVSVALAGLLLGSFANVLIARVPAGEDWVRGSSHCPRCRHDLAWYDNIPLFSWMWLRRRCRYCREPISARYPVVESLVALLFGAIAIESGATLATAALGYLAVISVALVYIDADVQRLPDSIVLPAYPIVAALLLGDAALQGEWGSVARAGLGLAIMGGFYGLMWLAYPAGLGLGDIKSAGLLGMVLGYLSWGQLAVGAIAGPLLGGVWVIVGLATRRLKRTSRVPYGPALFGGAWLGVLAGSAIASSYVALLTSG